MNKQEYIKELKAALKGADKTEVSRTIEFYSEMIDDALEDGMSENEVISGLETPSAVAARIAGETVAEKRKQGHPALFIIAVVLASPIWLPIVVSVIAVILSVYISLWAVVGSLIVSAIGTAAGAVLGVITSVMMYASSGMANSLFIFGTSLAAAGAAIYLMYLSCYIARQYVRLSAVCVSGIRKAAGKGSKRK